MVCQRFGKSVGIDASKLEWSGRMNDLHLRVESYDESEIVAIKQSLKGRIAVMSGVIVLTLGLFGLVSCVDEGERVEQQPPQPPYTLGGSGSWFISTLERL